MTSLSEHLAPEPERGRFVVDGPETALWALRKLAQAKGKQAEASTLAEVEHKRIDEWHAAEHARHQGDVDYFTALLTGWHRTLWESGDDRKTVNLPGGALKRREAREKVVVTDPAFVTWALEHHPGLVRTKHEPDLSTIAKELEPRENTEGETVLTLRATGEVVTGVAFERDEPKWTVEVSE